MEKESPEQVQLQRWLEGVKRYANKKGYDIAVSARKILDMPEPKQPVVEKVAASAFIQELQKISGIASELAPAVDDIVMLGLRNRKQPQALKTQTYEV